MSRYDEIKNAKYKIRETLDKKSNLFFIHYSCESFVENKKGSHRVTSIAIKNMESGQTHSFSIFQYSELLKKSVENDYPDIEKKLLEDYFKFIESNKNSYFVHWNMRNINFGFIALEHRFKVLGGQPFILDDNHKIDMARIVHMRFGKHYIEHPRLENLIKLNKITDKDFLSGSKEAEAFNKGNYLELHQSTLRKVDILEAILSKLGDNTLKVTASIKEIYGFTLEAVTKYLSEHWFFRLLTIISLLFSIGFAIVTLINYFR